MTYSTNPTQPLQYPECPNTEIFAEHLDTISEMYRQSFAGAPWYEDITFEQSRTRLEEQLAKPGFEAFIATADGEPVGGLWYDTPSVPELIAERGVALGKVAVDKMTEGSLASVVWSRETIVRPEVQGRGVALGLCDVFLGYLTETCNEGALALARMRSDNPAITAVARKFGYKQTGIEVPSEQNPSIRQEYWYRAINATAGKKS